MLQYPWECMSLMLSCFYFHFHLIIYEMVLLECMAVLFLIFEELLYVFSCSYAQLHCQQYAEVPFLHLLTNTCLVFLMKAILTPHLALICISWGLVMLKSFQVPIGHLDFLWEKCPIYLLYLFFKSDCLRFLLSWILTSYQIHSLWNISPVL